MWSLFAGVWERLHRFPPRFLQTSKDNLISPFVKSLHCNKVAKSRWITLFISVVWTLWQAYLDSSIDSDYFHLNLVRARYWDEIWKIIRRDKVLAVNPRFNTVKRHTPKIFRKI